VLTQAAEIMGDMVTGLRPATSGRKEPQTVKADVKPSEAPTP
jgi:hypothetical protein